MTAQNSFVDYPAIKSAVSIDRVIPLLDVPLAQHGDQWRGPCTACKQGGPRALVITKSKGAFYCFAQKKGGDVIALLAHVKGIGQKEAAVLISEHFRVGTGTGSTVSNSRHGSSEPERKAPAANGLRAIQPLTYLEHEHEGLQALGVDAETAAAWESGFASKGIMRGRYAVPIKTADGTLLAYVGVALSESESPQLLFPNGFDPASLLFATERVQQGSLTLLRTPLDVIRASQSGLENCVCFLTEQITPAQLEMLSGFMDSAGCETVEMY